MKDAHQSLEHKTADSKKDVWTTAGTVLVVLGVAVWGVYALCRWGLAIDVTGRQFLPYHLAGVIPGMILKRRRFLVNMIKKNRGSPPNHHRP